MAVSQANLVGRHYLHSTRFHFFHNLASLNVSQVQRQYGDINRLPKIIDKIRAQEEIALTREKLFYEDFNVIDNVDWANKYLRRLGGNNEKTIIIDVVDSLEMISILNTGKKGVTNAKNINTVTPLLKTIENDKDVPKYIVEMVRNKIQKSDISDIGDLFSQLGLFEKNKKKKVNNKEIQQIIFRALSKNGQNFEMPKHFIDKIGANAFKNYKKFVRDSNSMSKTNKIKNAINYFIRETTKRFQEKGFDVNKIYTIYLPAFEKMLKEKINDTDDRLLSTNVLHVTGEVSEKAAILAYIDIEEPTKIDKKGNTQINSMVKQMGSTLVDRFGDPEKSKVDTIWISPKPPHRKYFIQNKNTNQEIYRSMQVTSTLEDVEQRFVSLGLNSSASLKDLLNKIQTTGVLSEEDKDMLIYLLVNYNVLNKFEDLAKRNNNKKGIKAAAITKDAIDGILSQVFQIYMSDVYKKSEGQYAVGKNNDFIIYMNKFLIPKSLILRNIIRFLHGFYEETVMTFRVTSKLKGGYSKSDFDDMLTEKRIAREEEENTTDGSIEYDYHNEGLVSAGSFHGNMVIPAIVLNKPKITFSLKNLVKQSLI